jgi:hypothetical protein
MTRALSDDLRSRLLGAVDGGLSCNAAAEKRLDGLHDEPRPGAPRTITDQKIADVVTATLETLPSDRTHWSSRGMAHASGLAPL